MWFYEGALKSNASVHNFVNIHNLQMKHTFSESLRCPLHNRVIIFRHSHLHVPHTHANVELVVASRRRKNLMIFSRSQVRTSAATSSSEAYLFPLRCSLSFGNRKKSQGAKSGLYGGCAKMSSKLRRSNAAGVCLLVCGRALSCWRTAWFPGQTRSSLARSFFIVSTYRSELTVLPRSKNSVWITPWQ